VAAGVVALLAVARAASTFRNEYAAFRVSNHIVARPPAEDALPALADLSIDVPGRPALAAWLIPSRNGAAVLLAHGSHGDRASLWPEARVLAGAGFGVLLVDLPGHGESRGPVDWGAGGRAALAAAITVLRAQPGVDPGRVGAVGFSMGAMLVAQLAASDKRIRAVLLAGCFSDARRQTLFEYRRWGPITGWPAIWAYRAAGFDDHDQRPIDVIGRIAPRPLLVVQGTEDGLVAPTMAGELYAAAGEPRELWLVPGAGHGNYLEAAPVLWPERLRGFFLKSLAPLN
jgi:dipeptidyl aminopeptidase/acylaminoacyl peptidase